MSYTCGFYFPKLGCANRERGKVKKSGIMVNNGVFLFFFNLLTAATLFYSFLKLLKKMYRLNKYF